MTNRIRNGTDCCERNLDKELSEVLLSVSVVSKRIADRLSVSSEGKLNMEGGSSYGKSKRIIHARG